ncbi:MAG: hypothetical protein WB543_18345 [Candidatus Acidiferrum sp.]
MSCSDYRESLMEAAATNAAPSREMRSHMKACESCRAAFTEEMQLFAAIDTGLQSAANAEVPVSLLPRVRAQLLEEPVSLRSWIPAFAGVGIAAAVVVALVLVRKPARNAFQADRQAIAAAHNVPTALCQSIPTSVAPLEIVRTVRKHARVEAVKAAPADEAASAEPEVLIPAAQKRALDVLLAQLRQGELQTGVLLAEQPEEPIKSLEVAPLDIPPIKIKPLPDVIAETASPENKTKR